MANNESKRLAAEAAVLRAMEGNAGMSLSEIAERAQVHFRTAKNRVLAMCERGLVRVSRYCERGGQDIALYVLSAAPQNDAEDVASDCEHLLQEDIAQRHKSWLRGWRPYRPPEAAWIN